MTPFAGVDLPAVVKLLVFFDLLRETTKDAAVLGSLIDPERDGREYMARRWPRDTEDTRERLLQEWLSFLALPGDDFREKAVAYLAGTAP